MGYYNILKDKSFKEINIAFQELVEMAINEVEQANNWQPTVTN